jgi:hypothetical protein
VEVNSAIEFAHCEARILDSTSALTMIIGSNITRFPSLTPDMLQATSYAPPAQQLHSSRPLNFFQELVLNSDEKNCLA